MRTKPKRASAKDAEKGPVDALQLVCGDRSRNRPAGAGRTSRDASGRQLSTGSITDFRGIVDAFQFPIRRERIPSCATAQNISWRFFPVGSGDACVAFDAQHRSNPCGLELISSLTPR
ncbi:MAG TPA: hypothetical protein VF624_12630, partial [Tepidisphaeraceae bacterium]